MQSLQKKKSKKEREKEEREKFLRVLWALIDVWSMQSLKKRQRKQTTRERMVLLVHAILLIMDYGHKGLPAYKLLTKEEELEITGGNLHREFLKLDPFTVLREMLNEAG